VVDRHPLPHFVEDQPSCVGRDRGAELVLGAKPLKVIARESLVKPGVLDLDQAHLLQGGTCTRRDDELGQKLTPDPVLLTLDLVLLLRLREPPLDDVLLV